MIIVTVSFFVAILPHALVKTIGLKTTNFKNLSDGDHFKTNREAGS